MVTVRLLDEKVNDFASEGSGVLPRLQHACV